MSPSILRASARKAVPWKNGGGVTREIAVQPPGADMTGFDWRVSTAVVASDGPFSVFGGVDRTLLVLSGDGLGLTIDGAPEIVLTPLSPPLPFPGDAPVEGRLTGTEVVDLNLMVRRGGWTGQMLRRELTAETNIGCDAEAGLVMALEPATMGTGEALEPGDAVQLAMGDTLSISPRHGACTVIVIALSRLV